MLQRTDISEAAAPDMAWALTQIAALKAERDRLLEAQSEAEVIRDIHAVLTSRSTFASAMEAITNRILHAIPATYAQVWEQRSNSNYAHLLAFCVRDEADSEAFIGLRTNSEVPISQLVISDQFTDTSATLCATLDDEVEKSPRVQEAYRQGIRCFLASPLRAGTRRFALVVALRNPPLDPSHLTARLDRLAQAIRPILSRKLDEEQLVLLGSALGTTQDGVLLFRSSAEHGSDIVHLVNTAFAKKTGYAQADLRGRSPWMVISPLADPGTVLALREKASRHEPARAELAIRRRDGSTFWGELSLVKLPPVGDREEHFLALLRDVTQRRADAEAQRHRERELQMAAQTLRKRSEQLAQTQRIARLGAWRWQRARDVMDVSDSVYDIAGITPGRFLPSLANVLNLITPDDRRRVVRHFARWRALDGESELEFRILRPDGETRHIWTECAVETDAHGRLIGLNGIAQDITERKEAQAMLLHSEKLRSLGQLTGGIAHDFNNLLTVISLNLEMIGAILGPNSEVEDLRALAAKAARNGAELTSNLLAFARRQPLAPVPVDVARLLGALRNLAEPSLGERHRVAVQSSDALPRCLVDRSGLEGALLNLLVNSRDAMPKGGTILMEARAHDLPQGRRLPRTTLPPGQYVSISITDTGTGIPPALQDRIFEPFFTTKPSGKGTGLGLSSVIGFVRQSGGDLEVHSSPGEGTMMRIYLPAMA